MILRGYKMERGKLEDLSVEGRIILKCTRILKNWDSRAWLDSSG